MFHCSEESFPAEGICPVLSKFDSPGINGWGTTLSASQTHNVEWLPEVYFATMASCVQNTGAGRKTLTAEAADFPALIVSAPGLVLVQKAFCPPLPPCFSFLAVLISNRAGAPLLSHGRCWWWGGQLAQRRWPWHGLCEPSYELT